MAEEVLPLRLCTVVEVAGETVRPFVCCPRRSETIDALSCLGCERMRSVEWDPTNGGSVTCGVETAARAAIDRRADLAEAAARTPIREILPQLTTCLGAELSALEARRLLTARGLHVAGVVDAQGKLLGIVTSAELRAAEDSSRLFALVPADGPALLADAPIAHAIALMAVEGLRAVACVTAEGALLGVCEVGEVLRWVASRMGLVTPSGGGREG